MRRTEEGDVGTPFALTIPPLPPSSISVSRTSKSATPRPRKAADENTPPTLKHTSILRRDGQHATIIKTKRNNAVPTGDQTMFAPVLLAVGDQSLLMEQQLPAYKNLWNESEEEGDDEFSSFMADSMEQEGAVLRDGSVRSRGGKGLSRKSILGASAAGNQAAESVASVKSTKDRTSSSRLASLYKPTPKPDSSSRRRSTLFARESIYGEKGFEFANDGAQDVMVPLYAPSSPIGMGIDDSQLEGQLLMEETMTGIGSGLNASDTEEEGGGEVAVADEQVRVGALDRRNGSQGVSNGTIELLELLILIEF